MSDDQRNEQAFAQGDLQANDELRGAERPYKLDLESPLSVPDEQEEELPPIPMTKFLVGANTVMFLAMVIASGGRAFFEPSLKLLLEFGADFGPLTFTTDWWRVFSSMFEHIGILHIAANMSALFFIGLMVERLYGSSKFLFLYLVAGVGGALTSLMVSPNTVSAGASGAVFGVYGTLLSYIKVNSRHFPPGALSGITRVVVILLIYNLVYGMTRPGIDNACHIGGFLTGLVAGYFMTPPPGEQRWRASDVLKAIVLVAFLGAAFYFERLAAAG